MLIGKIINRPRKVLISPRLVTNNFCPFVEIARSSILSPVGEYTLVEHYNEDL
jgi:hypothetical protein